MSKSQPPEDASEHPSAAAPPSSKEIKQAKAVTDAARERLARANQAFENTRQRLQLAQEIVQHNRARRERQVELGNLPPPTPPRPVINILLIEDNPADVALIDYVLQECALSCRLTVLSRRSDVEAFFAQATTGVFLYLRRLIIADCMMPDMEVEDIMAAVRTVPAYQHVPVILFSALAEEEGHRRCAQCGATVFIHKPGELGAFVEAVSTMVHRWGGTGGGSDVTLANLQ